MAKNQSYAHKRGNIQESAIKALVQDPLFRMRVERKRKGKGSYQRHDKHRLSGKNKGESPFNKYLTRILLNGLSNIKYLILTN